VHRADQLGPNVVALECHACRVRYPVEEVVALGDPLQCVDVDCGAGGMIARTTPTLEERFPSGLLNRGFTPLPDALMRERERLGIGAHELLVIWALEQHRWLARDRVFPSRKRLSELTGLSDTTVRRTITRLADAGLITRVPRFRDNAGQTSNAYELDPLWDRLGSLAPESHRPGPESDRPGGNVHEAEPRASSHTDPGAPSHTDPGPWVTQTHEQEEDDLDEGQDIEPVGARTALAATRDELRLPTHDDEVRTPVTVPFTSPDERDEAHQSGRVFTLGTAA
jgi:DNA-binding transcriptional ArsR family regulator